MTFALKTDVSYELAYNAYRGTSFSPDKRAKEEQIDFARYMNGVYEELKALVKYPEQEPVFVNELNRYKEGYLKRLNALLSAKSRCMSSMITGPANFPFARNQKRLDVEHKRLEELLTWDKKVKYAIKTKLLAAIPADVQASKELESLKVYIRCQIQTINAIKRGEEPGLDKALFVSSLTGKLTRLAGSNLNLAQEGLRFLQSLPDSPIAKRNKIWAILEKEPPEQKTGTKQLLAFEGGEVVLNYDADRVQILFDEKPSDEMRQKLKKSAWRWSPSYGAWQRQATENAIYNVKRLLAS